LTKSNPFSNARSSQSSSAAAQATSGTSTWTTITPRFSIQYASYIPVDHVRGPRPCLVTATGLGGEQEAEVRGWLLYKGDANRSTYRTTQSLLLIPDVGVMDGWYARAGATRNYSTYNSPANGSTLSTESTGDPWIAPYIGADEDNVQYDCSHWNDKGEADNSTFQNHTFSQASGLNIFGYGGNPLEQLGDYIRWNATFKFNDTDPSNPMLTLSVTHSCYPAHIIKINGKTVYEWQPPNNSFPYIASCLLSTVGQINNIVTMDVPAY